MDNNLFFIWGREGIPKGMKPGFHPWRKGGRGLRKYETLETEKTGQPSFPM